MKATEPAPCRPTAAAALSRKRISRTRARPGRADGGACRRPPTSRQLREAYAAARVAWVELLADADIQARSSDDFETRVERGARAARRRRGGARRSRAAAPRARAGAGRAHGRVRRRRRRCSGDDITDRVAAGARRVGRHAADAGGVGRGAAIAASTEACRAAEKRHERPPAAQQSAERLPTLVPEIEALAATEDYNAIRGQWYALRKQWQAIARDVEIDAELVAPLRRRRAEARSARSRCIAKPRPAAAGREPAAAAGARCRSSRRAPAAESLTLKDADSS